MPKHPPSASLCAQLRERIIDRIDELKLKDFEAAEAIPPRPASGERAGVRGQSMPPRTSASRCA